ncbi:MAG: hypothetical protein EBU23_07515 [Mycobacteriaceae bacterium]|nr:hypothetical protein [Mycobacteriaceae bacterium]
MADPAGSGNELFDVVVPVGPNDVGRIRRQLAQLRFAVGRRRTFVVTARRADGLPQFDGCETVDEEKLYAGRTIPGILDRWLVVDADTFLLRPVEFVVERAKDTQLTHYGGAGGTGDSEHLPAYAIGPEPRHEPYFAHMARLHPLLARAHPDWSGICHHMVFQRAHVDLLFELVDDHHSRGNQAGAPKKEFWQVFLECVDPADYDAAGASEYEIYFNFVQRFLPREVVVRPLRWANATAAVLDDPGALAGYGLDYVSCHYYL